MAAQSVELEKEHGRECCESRNTKQGIYWAIRRTWISTSPIAIQWKVEISSPEQWFHAGFAVWAVHGTQIFGLRRRCTPICQ